MKKHSNEDCRLVGANVIKMVIWLVCDGMSFRKCAKSTNISLNSIRRINNRLELLGKTTWKELLTKSDDEITDLFYPNKNPSQNIQPNSVNENNRYVPNFKELALTERMEKRRALSELYDEYEQLCRDKDAIPFSRSYFYRNIATIIENEEGCDHNYYFMQEFVYGQWMEIDYTGDTYELSTYNGKVKCYIQVITFPASYYSVAAFVPEQSTSASCTGIAECIKYLGYKTAHYLICDNAKSWVINHKHGDPVLNKLFSEFMAEMGVCICPAPARHPQKKSAVEYSVRLIQDAIKRNQAFQQSLSEMKTICSHTRTLTYLIEKEINAAPFRKNALKTRSYLFHTYEIPHLISVSNIPDIYDKVFSVPVYRNYHIKVGEHNYSVPYTYVGKSVEIYEQKDYIIIRYQGKEIARHMRKDEPGKTTLLEHMTPEHRNIQLEKGRLTTKEEILEYSLKLDENLHFFCSKRISLAMNNPSAYLHNALVSCKSIIRFYEREKHKNLVSEACLSVLQLPFSSWNRNTVESLYFKSLKSGLSGEDGNSEHKQSEMIRSDGADAYIRN